MFFVFPYTGGMKTPIEPKRKPGRPATGETPKRIFRMGDSDWAEVESAARKLGVTNSVFVRDTLLKAARRVAKAN